MISWGENALKGLCSHERNKCQAICQAVSPGEPCPCPAEPLMGLLGFLSSFSSCESRLKSFPFTPCNQHHLPKVILSVVCAEGSHQLWSCSARGCWNGLWCAGAEAGPESRAHSSHTLPGGAPCARLTLDLEIKLQIDTNSLHKRNGTIEPCLRRGLGAL